MTAQKADICERRLAGAEGVVAHLAEAHQVSPEQAGARFGLRVLAK